LKVSGFPQQWLLPNQKPFVFDLAHKQTQRFPVQASMDMEPPTHVNQLEQALQQIKISAPDYSALHYDWHRRVRRSQDDTVVVDM
jgi:hypothetical protein